MTTRFKHFSLTASLGTAAAIAFGVALVDTPALSAGSLYGVNAPAPRIDQPSTTPGTAQAVLAGGCFWGMEAVFSHVKGVTNVVSGYAGGDKAHANYADSSSGRYDDAEAVRVTYDPSQISYADLLQIYFAAAHDPTQKNRQGPDVGPQYRSEIFAANADQARVANAYIKQLQGAHVYDAPIATSVSTGKSFFPAEAYHQNYALAHPNSMYLRINDEPKVEALSKRFPDRYTKRFIGGDRLAATN